MKQGIAIAGEGFSQRYAEDLQGMVEHLTDEATVRASEYKGVDPEFWLQVTVAAMQLVQLAFVLWTFVRERQIKLVVYPIASGEHRPHGPSFVIDSQADLAWILENLQAWLAPDGDTTGDEEGEYQGSPGPRSPEAAGERRYHHGDLIREVLRFSDSGIR